MIDPPLLCSTYLGGTGSDVILSVAESNGSVVTVCGQTNGDFPVTPNAFDRTYGGGVGGWPDAFIAQFDLSRAGPEQLVYSTYLGGPGVDGAQSVMVDARGVITMVGGGSSGFPTTANAYRQTVIGRINFCVVRLDPTLVGTAQLLYSTFIGDDTQDLVFDAALDRVGRVTFVGYTNSSFLPVTEGAIGSARSYTGDSDGYVICLDPALPPARQVVYCTYVGGHWADHVRSVIVAPDGTLVIAGYTDSDDLRTTEGAYQRAKASTSRDAFVWILDPSRIKDDQLVYGTYLGGADVEQAYSVAMDVDGTVTVVGTTQSLDFPTTPNAFSRVIVPSTGSDGFITRLDPFQRGAAQLVYSTFFGGRSSGDGINCVNSRFGLVTVGGNTYSVDLPTTIGSFARARAGDLDLFVAQLDTVRSRLIYGTYIGGARSDSMWDLMLNEEGVATVAGSTVSFDYPTTPNAYQRTYAAGGLSDACLTQLELQADGLVRFGRGTRGCTGPVLLRGTAMPQMGNVGFSILCTNAPPLSAGALLIAGRRLQSSFAFAGAELWIDPSAATVLALSSSNLFRSDTSMPIPARTDLIGIKLFAQAVWVGPSSPLPCPPLGLSTSFGLEITVQP